MIIMNHEWTMHRPQVANDRKCPQFQTPCCQPSGSGTCVSNPDYVSNDQREHVLQPVMSHLSCRSLTQVQAELQTLALTRRGMPCTDFVDAMPPAFQVFRLRIAFSSWVRPGGWRVIMNFRHQEWISNIVGWEHRPVGKLPKRQMTVQARLNCCTLPEPRCFFWVVAF